ncbi:hypothetical protein PCASD_24674 [Puccinia coronata f. sp. avenae]|uniref:Uncharacterized protein n=1 Tax=Puccinia coronata f. sp. avenae TaxID=200324 RepID=A0A2N5RZU4_9BASI|nr:hypothetical protein PCASD_24674 [Puccinia coronata f. sp. avenae]
MITCLGALIHDDESPWTARISPDALSFPHVLPPIPTSEVQTSHLVPPVEEAPTQAASTSFQWLGRLPSSNKFNPPNNSGGLTTHFIPHAVSPNYRSDFGLAGHVEDPDFGSMGYVEDPSRMDQLMEELQGLLETEEPLDVHENNPNPTTMLPSAHQERQTAQNLGDIHDSSGSFQVPSIFDNPSNSPRDLQISSFSPGSGSNPRQKRKSESATNLNESRLKNKIETLPSLINVGKFTHDSQRLQEQMASLLSKHTPNGPLGKKKPLPKPDSIRLPKFSRENDFPPVGIHNHVQQSRLPCIDEEGSLLLHSGAFSIENPSSTDTRKMKIFNSMVDNSNTSGKLLWILEDRLAACIEQFHGKSSINKDKTEVNDECGNRMKMRDSKREEAVTIINSKLDDWLKFYEAKCGIEYKDLGLFRDPGLEEDVMKTYFVLFLLRVDIISTVLVKKEPQISNVKITLSNNLDVLKYAAENFHHIYQQSRDRINQLKRNQVIDKYIRERASKVRAANKVNIFIETWLKLGGNEDTRIPFIPWEKNVVRKYLSSLFEDVWFYTVKSLDEDISNVVLEKIRRKRLNYLNSTC